MRVIARLQDTEFPYVKTTHTRKVVRGVVYNDNFEIAVLYLHTVDETFGERDLFETPGGGVEKGEKLIDAFRREIYEEVGATLDNIVELGRVIDYYNQIYRRNDNHFYLAHIKSLGERHLVEYEKKWNLALRFMSIDDAIEAYENTRRDLPVNNLVRARELPVLKLAKRKLESIKKN